MLTEKFCGKWDGSGKNCKCRVFCGGSDEFGSETEVGSVTSNSFAILPRFFLSLPLLYLIHGFIDDIGGQVEWVNFAFLQTAKVFVPVTSMDFQSVRDLLASGF